MNTPRRITFLVLVTVTGIAWTHDARAVSFEEAVPLTGEAFSLARQELMHGEVTSEQLGLALAKGEWREQLTAMVLDGWLRHADTYQSILDGPRLADQLGNIVLPGLLEATQRDVDVMPLYYELVLKETAQPESMIPLIRQLQAIGRRTPGKIDVRLLIDALTDPVGVSGPVRGYLAQVASVTENPNLSAMDFIDLLRQENSREEPSSAVQVALVNGVIRAARDRGPSRDFVIQQLLEAGESADLPSATLVRAAGAIGGRGAEAIILDYLQQSRTETEQRWALNALARVDTDRALETTLAYAKPAAPSAYVREAAIGSLGRYTYRGEIAERLEEIAGDDARPSAERRKAVDSFRHMQRKLLPGSKAAGEVEVRLRRLSTRELGDQDLTKSIETVLRALEPGTDEQ